MKNIEIKQIQHDIKIGDECGNIKPNITDDCILIENGQKVGFFLRQMPENMCKIADLCDYELRSKNVPKSQMKRSSGLHSKENEVLQYSTIIGSVPPKPHMRRVYPTISSVHQVKTARTFIKGMLKLANESEKLIQKYMPEQYESIKKTFDEHVDEKWKFGKIFTSSISNFNINANFHIDKGNIPNTLNVIISKRKNSTGGNLNVPDYGATFDQKDNSILVYPAWRNVHGVTPIIPKFEGGYRNTLVFYPLKAFINKESKK